MSKKEKKIVLTPHQQKAFDKIVDFIRSKDAKVFILKGYAGTGKTTMMKCLIEELSKRNESFQLLASTGRAAKILSNISGYEAKTIHSFIYRFSDFNQDIEEYLNKEKEEVDIFGQLIINFDAVKVSDDDISEVYYLVDESSMVADKENTSEQQARFGSGKLLSDLLDYNPNGKFIFIGDACQLPPVTQTISPALSKSYLSEFFSIEADEIELTEVIRQDKGNDIVRSAEKVRKLYFNPPLVKWAKFPLKNYKNIHILNSTAELYSAYIDRTKNVGYDNSTLICYSNKQCCDLTKFLRPAFGINISTLSKGDLLLVTQNNLISGLLNGDLVVVESVGRREHRAGLTFLNVEVKELHSEKVYSQYLIEEILYTNGTNLSQEQQKSLFIDYYNRVKEKLEAQTAKQNSAGQQNPNEEDEKKKKGSIQRSAEFRDGLQKDPYLNALRAVYGFALTCHKAQGGEWDYVYLDIPRYFSNQAKPYVYQWIYTAMTRAKKELYLVDDFWVI